MEKKHPSSPDEVIDSRWARNPQAVTPTPHTTSRHASPRPDLDAQMRAIINPWLANDRGTAETLKALRVLADENL